MAPLSRNRLTARASDLRPCHLLLGLSALLFGCGLSDCPDRRGDAGHKRAQPPSSSPSKPAPSRPLAALLDRLPEEVRWAVLTGGLGPVADRAEELSGLLAEHPDLETPLRSLKARFEKHLGLWPFDAAGRRTLGLSDESALVLYGLPRPAGAAGRSRMGLLVSGVRPRALASAISTALRRRGRVEGARVGTRRVKGRLLLTFGKRVSCAYDRGASWCVEGPPERWAELTRAPRRSLRSGPLGALSETDLSGDLGVYWAEAPARWPPLATALLGLRPRRLWAALSLGERPRIHAVLLRDPALSAPPSASGEAPFPAGPRRPVGLATATGAEAALRLRLSPDELLGLLGALGEVGKEAADLVGPLANARSTTLGNALSGELLLLSFPEGLGAVLGLKDLPAAKRGLSNLSVRLSARLPAWQRKIREQGAGWNLAIERHPGVTREAQGLLLELPAGRGPTLPSGRLRLVWGLSGSHLVIATDLHLFRRLKARTAFGDEEFLGAPQSADRRQAFARSARISLALQADDPFALLPAPQRAALQEHLDTLGPFARRLLRGLRMAGDLLHEITLSQRAHPAGIAVEVCLGLPRGSAHARRGGHRTGNGAPALGTAAAGEPPWIDPAYREALRRKWGGNLTGHNDALAALGRQEIPSALRDKARRNLPPPDPTPHSGALGLTASGLLPLATGRLRRQWRDEARVHLTRLGALLRALSAQASALPPRARARWHRSLRSAPLTPPRRCCAAPDHLCRSEPRDWRHPTWKSLGFQIKGPHHFRYSARVERGSVRTRIVFRAVADLDCDGRFSQFELPARVDEATGHLTLDKLRLLRAEP